MESQERRVEEERERAHHFHRNPPWPGPPLPHNGQFFKLAYAVPPPEAMATPPRGQAQDPPGWYLRARRR